MSRGKWSGGISLPPSQLGSEMPEFRLWLTSFSGRAGLIKNRVLWSISKWFHFLFLCQKSEGIFSDIYSGKLVELLDVNLRILLGTPYDWGLLAFLTLRVVHIDPQQFINYSSGFSASALVLMAVYAGDLCFDKLWLPSVLEAAIFPCVLYFLKEWRRVVDFSFYSSFYCC